MRSRFLMFAALMCAMSWARIGFAAENPELAGQVTRVIDGDTLELTVAPDRLIKIRLAQIDAPEKNQPYGKEATAALSSLTLGKRVRVEVVDVDKYGRSVGEIYLIDGDGDGEDVHVNFELVRQGHAWAYTRYVKSVAIIELEDEARKGERGLWKLPLEKRDPPWEHRRRRKPKRDPSTCGTKRTCNAMASCAEARFYLRECGLARLDADGDGVPCESTKCRK